MSLFRRWEERLIERRQTDAMACLQDSLAAILLHIIESPRLSFRQKREQVLVYWRSFRLFTYQQNNRPANQSRQHMRSLFLTVLRDLRRKEILADIENR